MQDFRAAVVLTVDKVSPVLPDLLVDQVHPDLLDKLDNKDPVEYVGP